MMKLFTGMAQANYSEKLIDNINKEISYIAALLGRIIFKDQRIRYPEELFKSSMFGKEKGIGESFYDLFQNLMLVSEKI